MTHAVPRRVVLFGVSGSGKSTLGEGLHTHFGHHIVAFADPIKHAAKIVFGFSDEDLWGPSHTRETPYLDYEFSGWCFSCRGQCIGPERYVPLLKLDDDQVVELEELKHQNDPDYWICMGCGARYPKYVTPREVLRTLGTAWGRQFCKDVWSAAAFRRLDPNQCHVITDGRFQGELNQAKKNRACTVLLKRGLLRSTSSHQSEAEVRSMAREPNMFDIILDNREGTPEENRQKLFDAFNLMYRRALEPDHPAANVEWTVLDSL